MQILISCAKTMGLCRGKDVPPATEPLFYKDAEAAIPELMKLNVEEVQSILRVNRQIAAENVLRYQGFYNEETKRHPALLSYTGIVFKHIAPEHFTSEDWLYAQQHLCITSFLYGLLRPLDKIRPYRLEGDVILTHHPEQNRFEYWRERLTDYFINRIKADDGILVNLASSEMKKIFDWKRVTKEVTVITPDFKVYKDGKLKSIVVYTKMCRGEMTRFILKNKILNPEELRLFEWEGFCPDYQEKGGGRLLFTLDEKG